jgi:hypothetical protein
LNKIKQAFLDSKNKLKAIVVPELGETVYIGKWSGIQRATIIPEIIGIEEEENKSEKYKDTVKGMAKIVQVSLLDGEGNRVFEDSDEDLAVLLNFDGEVVEKLFTEILEHNGIGEKALPEAAKN